MAKKPPAPAAQPFIPVDGLINAPVIYFEACPTIGNNNGLINVMLATSLVEPVDNGGVATRIVAVAHLRMTTLGAINLRDSINNALLIGAPVENPEGKAN
jgi:hypothetical protein